MRVASVVFRYRNVSLRVPEANSYCCVPHFKLSVISTVSVYSW